MAVDCQRASRTTPGSCGTGPVDRGAPGGNAARRRTLRNLKAPRFSLVQLAPTHDLERFASGKHPGAAEIDEYLKTSALAEQRAGLSQVWIALDSHDAAVAGYLTLSPLSVPISPEVLAQLGLGSVPYRAVGGYLLGRLGVAVHRQGEGLGGVLVAAAIESVPRLVDIQAMPL